jgi:hypothetical protein
MYVYGRLNAVGDIVGDGSQDFDLDAVFLHADAIAGRNRLRLGLKCHVVTQQRMMARRAVLATRERRRT